MAALSLAFQRLCSSSLRVPLQGLSQLEVHHHLVEVVGVVLVVPLEVVVRVAAQLSRRDNDMHCRPGRMPRHPQLLLQVFYLFVVEMHILWWIQDLHIHMYLLILLRVFMLIICVFVIHSVFLLYWRHYHRGSSLSSLYHIFWGS